MTTGIVFDIKQFSLHDGPGIRTTVFFKGCPLRCGWCHNPEGIDRGQELIARAGRCIRCGACLAVCPEGAVHEEGDAVVTDRERCSLCGACVEACFAEAREIVGRETPVAEVMARRAWMDNPGRELGSRPLGHEIEKFRAKITFSPFFPPLNYQRVLK